MTTPVIVARFGPQDQPFTLDQLNSNFAALVGAINALAADTVLQLGATPGNVSGYLPITGGSLAGQLTAPSVLVGPVAGPQYPVVTTNDAATTGARGAVKMAAAVLNLTQTISNPPTQAEVTAIQSKVNELLGALRTAGSVSP